jgi:hypothetical protein
MAATDPMTAERRRFSIRLPRPLWIGLALIGLLAVGVGPQLCNCIFDNKILMQRLRVDSSMEVEIWKDCSWEVSSPISYSIKKKGLPRTRFWSFAFVPPPALSRIRVELVQPDGCDIIAVVDALSPKSVFVLIDKRTGEAHPSLRHYDDRREFKKTLLSRFVRAAADKDYVIVERFCDKWQQSAE